MGLFSGLGSAIGSVLGGPVGGALGTAAGDLWNDYSSRKAAKKQYNYQMEMWNLNNEYNSPKAQMERLREANLNPNLVYGNGSATHTATMASAPAVNYKDKGNLLQNALLGYQMDNMRATNNNLEAQNQLLASQRDEVEARTLAVLTGIPKIKTETRILEKNANIYDRTGVNPVSSGPFSWASGLANEIAGVYQSLGDATYSLLETLFGQRPRKGVGNGKR